MIPPEMSPEQRAAALATARAVRQARAEVKKRLRDGSVTIGQLIADAATDDVIGKMRVSEVLEAMPGIGKVGVGRVMTDLEIAPTRRLRGLGERQRRVLVERFESPPPQ